MPAHIKSNNKEFIGEAMWIPPLKEKIISLSGDISEQTVLALAQDIFNLYEDMRHTDVEEWRKFKETRYQIDGIYSSTVNNCRIHLKRFLKKYSQVTIPDDNGALLSQQALAKDWQLPEEDEAWKDL